MKIEEIVLRRNGIFCVLAAAISLPTGGMAVANGFILGGIIGGISFCLLTKDVDKILQLVPSQAVKKARIGHLIRIGLFMAALSMGLAFPHIVDFWTTFAGLLGIKIAVFTLGVRGELDGNSDSI